MTYPVPSRSWKEQLETSTTEYQKQLPGSLGESALLTRGLTPETIQKFRLGYVASPLSGDEPYRGRIAIPYLTTSGIVSMRFKRVGDFGDKMLVHSGDKARPYNVNALHHQGMVAIVEGEPDVWIADQIGLPAVGMPGSKSWKKLWRRLFRRWDVLVIEDGDEPGMEMGKDIVADLRPVANSVRKFTCPEDLDLTDLYQKHGPEELRRLLEINDDE